MAFIFRSISTHFSNDLSYTTVIVHYRSAAFQHIIYVYTCNHQSSPRTSNICTTDFNINRTFLQCMYIMGVLYRQKHLVYRSCIISQQNISGTVLVSSHSKTSRVPFLHNRIAKHLVNRSFIITQQNIACTVLVSSHSKTARVPFLHHHIAKHRVYRSCIITQQNIACIVLA